MITLDARLDKKEFKLIDQDGVEHELYVGKFTAPDGLKMYNMQKDKGDKLTFAELSISRLLCAVKHKDGSYFWDVNSLDDFDYSSYPQSLIMALNEMINEANPFSTDLKSKKKSS